VLALLPLMVVAAFSGSRTVQTAPAPRSGVANISGTWSGTSDWEQQSVHSISGVRLSIDQDDRTVTGTLAFTSPAYQGWRGTITGTLAGTSPDTQFVGTIDLRAPAAAGGGACRGTAVFAGRSAATSLRWDTSRVTIGPGREGVAASACRGALRSVVLSTARD
jgi:hypothetical protein